MTSSTYNYGLITFNDAADKSLTFDYWRQAISGSANSNMTKIDTAIYGVRTDLTTAQSNISTLQTTATNLQTNINNVQALINMVKISTIVSTGTNNEFNFTSIPNTYTSLKILGFLKNTATNGSFPAVTYGMTLNGDSGTNYAQVNPSNGSWTGHGSNINAFCGNIISNWSSTGHEDDVHNMTPVEIDIYYYASTSMYKQIVSKGLFFNYQWAGTNPTNGIGPYLNVWSQSSAVNSLQISGTYMSNISYLSLYGIY